MGPLDEAMLKNVDNTDIGHYTAGGGDQGHREFPFWNDKIPPRQRKNSQKFPFPKLTVFVGIHGTKKISDKPTGIYCDLRIVNGIT